VFGFLGPNGAGKTRMVRTLGTLLAPASGSATVAGIPLGAATGPAIRARISIMPESPSLYLRLTVAENLQFFAGLHERSDTRARIERALRAVNLLDRADDLCGSLSKGLRQRVALARALLNDPAVLFLDEPTSGLDPVATREVHELLAGLRQRGVTIFLTTHRLEEAERLCDRVAILNTTLRIVGRPDELREQLFTRTLDVRVGAPLGEVDRVFAHVPGVKGWEQATSGSLRERSFLFAGGGDVYAVGPSGLGRRNSSWRGDDGYRPIASSTYELRWGAHNGNLSVNGSGVDPVLPALHEIDCR